jgi:hypothetical protein
VGEQGLFNGDVVLDGLRVEIPKFEFATDSPLEEAGFEPSVPLCFGAFTRSKTSASGPVGVGGFEKREFAGRGRTSTKSVRRARQEAHGSGDRPIAGVLPSPLSALGAPLISLSQYVASTIFKIPFDDARDKSAYLDAR